MAAHPSLLGSIEEFKPHSGSSIKAYLERVNIFFTVNDIPEDKQTALFLTLAGEATYSLLRSLCAPTLPSAKKYADLTVLLTTHLEPEPLVISERFHFHRRAQKEDESVAEFCAELRRLATTCSFTEAVLDETLRDRFVCGIRSEATQRRLLTEKTLTLKSALEIALSMESADKTAKSMKDVDSAAINLVREPPVVLQQNVSCYRCGKKNHESRNCRFRKERCHNCGKVGHIAKVCHSAPISGRRQNADQKKQPGPSRRVRQIEQGDLSEEDSDEFCNQIFVLGSRSKDAYKVDVSLNCANLTMEVDTGAAVSIISRAQLHELLPEVSKTLKPASVRLRTYTGEYMKIAGEAQVNVIHNGQQELLPLVVVEEQGPPLIGRNWLRKIQLDWKTICAIRTTSCNDKLQKILNKHSAVFKDELGTISSTKGKLYLKSESRPKFFQPRSIPYAIKPAVDQELDRLESSGVIRPVPTSEWAAPIVPVPKKDGKIRICGDFKVTINPVLDVEQYPLPKPQDLFATLAGGEKFTKLDLQSAYLQLELEEESRKFVTINTHRGLFEYTRLPFGVSSAPALFQRVMDSILQGIPRVKCYIDDILITGANDEEHLQNLEQVLCRLEAEGVRLKKSKCQFFKSSVEYLGHRVDATGLHPTTDKLRAVAEAPAPKNLKELRSFLGLINYYGSFIPNLSALLNPLNSLLQKKKKWKWTDECQKAFEAAKGSLTSESVLIHYDPSLPIKLAADASFHGLGAVLSHVLPGGAEHPVAFASRTLSPSERNYSQVEKEALGLIFAVKKFHQYIYGRSFSLITDHKPLLTILGPKNGIPSLAAARLQRWALLLSGYSYTIEYKTSASHGNADALSRLPLQESTPVSFSPAPSYFNIGQIESLPVTCDTIQRATRRDPILSKVLQYTKKGWPSQVPDVLKPYYNRRLELTVEGECLLWGIRVVVPYRLQESILSELHRDHPGVSRMKSVARSYVWWPKLDKSLEKLASSCVTCQRNKQAPPLAPLHPWLWPQRPWQRIHVDFAGPFRGKMFILIVDAHSKWPEIHMVRDTTTTKTISVLRQLFARFGLPQQIVSDNGPQFTSEEFRDFTKKNGIKHIRSSPYHPATNGAVERLVRTFKVAMKAGDGDGRTLQHRLQNFLLTYRSTPHATTHETPAYLFLGRDIRTRLDLLKPGLEETIVKKQATQKEKHDVHVRKRSLLPGDHVLARNKTDWCPGVILEQIGPLSYRVKVGDKEWKRHIDLLKKISSPSSEDYHLPSPEVSPAQSEQSETTVPSPSVVCPQPIQVDSNQRSDSVTQTSERRYPRRLNRREPDRYCDTYLNM